MKNFFLVVMILVIGVEVFAKVPLAFRYQALARE